MPLLFSLLFLFINLHDYHVSKCEVGYNPEKSRLEITQYIFLDDLDIAIEEAFGQKQHYCTLKEENTADSLLQIYINSTIKLTSNGDTINLSLLGKEITEDLAAVNVYLYSDSIELKSLRIKHDLLMEVYDDQANLIYWTSGSGKKAYAVMEQSGTSKLFDND